jgi:dipeptidyl aminopeptidase/acylaminoacyl peptidase
LDERNVLFHAYRAATSGLYVVDLESGSVELIAGSQGHNAGVSVDRANQIVVQSHGSFEALGEVAVFDIESRSTRVICHHNAEALAESPPASWERFEIERGEFTIEAWLLKPTGFDPAKRYPVIIDVHGGPNWYYGNSFEPVQQCLATNGFLLVIANPRGSTTYGRHFTQQVIGDWGGEDFKDLMAAVDLVLGRPYADPARTGIYGYSYGGYMTAWTISQTNRFQAAVCGAPCFDLESMYGTSDISYYFGAQQWTGTPHEARAWYESHSPSTFAHQTRTPTLIVHGEADERCPIGQGEQMFVALHQAGCDVEFARYPGGPHGFPWMGPPEHREDYLTRVLGWFKQHLGEPT